MSTNMGKTIEKEDSESSIRINPFNDCSPSQHSQEMEDFLEERKPPLPYDPNHVHQEKLENTSPIFRLGEPGFLMVSLHWLLGAIVLLVILIGSIVAGLHFSKMTPNSTSSGSVNGNDTQLLSDGQGLQLRNCQEQVIHLLNAVNSVATEMENQTGEHQRFISQYNELKNLSAYQQKQLTGLKSHFKNKNWDAELLLAIDQQDEGIITELINFGANINGRNANSDTPLIRAAMCNDTNFGLRMIKHLIENGATANAKNYNDYTFLHKLVDDGTNLTPAQFHDIAKFLIGKNLTEPFNIQGNFRKGLTTPRYDFRYTMTTPVQLAVKNLDVKIETLRMLLANGVNFNLTNSEGDSLLSYAIEGKRSTVLLSNLISLGSDYKHVNKLQDSLLHQAALYSNLQGTKFLVKLGLDVNQLNSHGNPPLNYVALYGRKDSLEIIRFLIDNGADVKIRNRGSRESALDRATIRYDNTDKDKIIQLLRDSH